MWALLLVRRDSFLRATSYRYYRALKSIGELFPGPSKTTRAYLHPEESVVNALEVTRVNMGPHCHMHPSKTYFPPPPGARAGLRLQARADRDDWHELLFLSVAGSRAQVVSCSCSGTRHQHTT